jgi:hypothetical protein
VDPASIAAGVVAKSIDPAAKEGAAVAGGLIRNLFGPVSEQMGMDLLEKYKNRNVQEVVDRSYQKRPGSGGSIPPRLGATVFDAASYADDEIVSEYLSGVLASSRTPSGKDDAGIAWSALIARLPADHLRVHFALYSSAAVHLQGIEFDGLHEFGDQPLWMPLMPFSAILGGDDWVTSFNDAMINLEREGLIAGRDVAGDGTTIVPLYSPIKAVPKEPALRYHVSASGVQLYLWGLGHGRTQALKFASMSIPSDDTHIPVPVPGSCKYGDLPDA